MPPTCAFLATDDLEGFFTYDHLAVPWFESLGWAVEEVPWRAEAEWSRYEIVVIRSAWDYQDAPEDFLRVLSEIDAATRLENGLDLCRWNLEKTYLRDLEDRGVAVVPTLWRAAGAPLEPSLFDRLGTGEIVVKPVVGANADRTHRIRRDELEARRTAAERDLAGRAGMVQPFLTGIVEEGEYSLFSFDGVFSHAVLKTPTPGDFRVQEEHGGRIRTVEAEPALLAAGEAALAALDRPPLYARADFVRCGGRFLLMELELIEPSLYFPFDPESPRRFAEATVRRVDARSSGRRRRGGAR
ncbi:MAG: hypothetical protein PVG07_10685 [Acidobacteriota bacterium]|jgi:hypothetical protein